MGARVVMLVPWRGGDAMREKHWGFVRPHLESFGYPLFTGDSPGGWARAAACNAAAASAGGWDVAIIADADSLLEPEPVATAVRVAARTGGAARPHNRRFMLSLGATKWVMSRGLKTLPERFLRWPSPGGGALVVSRKAWDAVGGYDTRFVGWGYEDSAMNIALVDRWRIIEGNSYHLFHAPGNIRSPAARANREILDEYRAANDRRIRAASRRAGFDLNTVL